MSLHEDIDGEWAVHDSDPEGVASRMAAAIPSAAPAEREALAALLMHTLVEHLGQFADAARLVDELAPPDDPERPDWAVRHASTVALLEGRDEDVERGFSSLSEREGGRALRASHEARALSVAASAALARGSVEQTRGWMSRAASIIATLPNGDPAVRSVAATANNLTQTLESLDVSRPDVSQLLRSMSALARMAWERAGTWLHVERAEYRLAMASLALGEPLGAVCHATSCLSICEAHDADAFERTFAWQAVVLSRHAAGDLEGARAARDELGRWGSRVESSLRPFAEEALTSVEHALAV